MARRLRALNRWAECFDARWPTELEESDKYYNWKIPILMSVVQGRHAQFEWQRSCVNSLVVAASRLVQNGPANVPFRVVASIAVPWLFGSEVCIYSDRDYFLHQLQRSPLPNGDTIDLEEPPLLIQLRDAVEVPQGFSVWTTAVRHEDEDEDDPDGFVDSFHLWIGETSWD